MESSRALAHLWRLTGPTGLTQARAMLLGRPCWSQHQTQQHNTFSSSSSSVPEESEDEKKMPDHMMSTIVNGKEVWVPKGSSVMQACDAAGVDIPRFCYHPKLSVAGNCRMCLVDLENERGMSPKPVASCAMPLAPGTTILTDTDRVKKAREGVMEFLLLNHPLDCPICDQGGECDLQDQAMHYGSDRGRFVGQKRTVVDKNLGPLVKTVMTRCIHCTRCVRYAKEVAGVEDLGVTGRGGASEIGTYVNKLMESELSGNVIDLCPVGALTSKPYAFTARQWELKPTESVDVSDALGCNIRVDSRGTEVLRILPRNNEEVNEDWISDKARFQYDGLQRQRLNVPMAKGAGSVLKPVKWEEALTAVAEAAEGVSGEDMAAYGGKLADCESLVALKDLANRLGCETVQCEDVGQGVPDADLRSTYLFNPTLSGVDAADVILMVGTNPRVEAPVLNARIRKAQLEGVPIGMLGEDVDLTYPTTHLGGAPPLSAKKNADFSLALDQARRPLVLVGANCDPAVMAEVEELFEKRRETIEDGWNPISVLHQSASTVGALDLGYGAAPKAVPEGKKLVFLLGADEIDVPEGAFVVYIGHHGDKGACRADVVLPAAAFTEKHATYVNTEGRPQHARRAIPPPGEARDDWKILRALSEVMGHALPYDDLRGVRSRLCEVSPTFERIDEAPQKATYLGPKHKKGKVGAKTVLRTTIENFYQTDVISRASLAMAKATQARANQ